jgi:hypothetical protein
MRRLFLGAAFAALMASASAQSIGPVAGPGGPGNISPPILTQNGHVVYAGSIPAVSACGTGTLAAGSTDTAGEATATGATGCTLTFGQPFASAPSCHVTDETGTRASMSTAATATALTVAGMTSGDKFSYFCPAKIGF